MYSRIIADLFQHKVLQKVRERISEVCTSEVSPSTYSLNTPHGIVVQ